MFKIVHDKLQILVDLSLTNSIVMHFSLIILQPQAHHKRNKTMFAASYVKISHS